VLRRTIQRQLLPKLTFALAETTYGTGDGLLVARWSLDGGNMRTEDIRESSRIGARSAHARMIANGWGRPDKGHTRTQRVVPKVFLSGHRIDSSIPMGDQ
jgi:hypothetical protein